MQINGLRRLLDTQIGLPSGEAIVRALNWVREGLGIFLPERIRQSGWRPRNRLIYLSSDLGIEQTHAIDVSRFGELRHSASETLPSLPTHIALHQDNYFTTHLSLPAEAAGSFTKAVALRLNEISPIPPEDAAFAIGKVKTDAEGRANANIAITTKRKLQEASEQYGGDNVSAIGAAPNTNGALEFFFSRKNSGPSSITKHRFINAALVAASVLFLVIAVDAHQQRRLKMLSDHETQALSALRSLRPITSLFNEVDAAVLQTASGQPIYEVVNAIDDTLATLPHSAIVMRLQLSKDTLELNGLLPSEINASANSFTNLLILPSDYPGFDRFDLVKQPGAAP